MAVRYGTLVLYGTPQFLLRSTVPWYGTFFFFFFVMVRTGTVLWYALLIKKTQTFRTLRWLFVNRSKTAKTDAKCVNRVC